MDKTNDERKNTEKNRRKMRTLAHLVIVGERRMVEEVIGVDRYDIVSMNTDRVHGQNPKI